MTGLAHSTTPGAPSLVERVLAPGADAALLALLRDWLVDVPRDGRVLDVGAGARSRVAAADHCAIAVDRHVPSVATGLAHGVPGVAATATDLPFADHTFDAVASLGLLHHLSDTHARATVREMLRVTHTDGRIALFDAVLPEPPWRRPLAWAIRRADRGRFVRRAAALRALLPEPRRWCVTRLTYARTGLEGVWCTRG